MAHSTGTIITMIMIILIVAYIVWIIWFTNKEKTKREKEIQKRGVLIDEAPNRVKQINELQSTISKIQLSNSPKSMSKELYNGNEWQRINLNLIDLKSEHEYIDILEDANSDFNQEFELMNQTIQDARMNNNTSLCVHRQAEFYNEMIDFYSGDLRKQFIKSNRVKDSVSDLTHSLREIRI